MSLGSVSRDFLIIIGLSVSLMRVAGLMSLVTYESVAYEPGDF